MEHEHERAKLEREIAGRVLTAPKVICPEFSRVLMESDLRESLVEGIELQLRHAVEDGVGEQCGILWGGERYAMARALDTVWEDGDMEVEGSDAWETEEDVDETVEGEISRG